MVAEEKGSRMASSTIPQLAGARVLIVEDNDLVAAYVSDVVRDEGGDVIGPVARAAEAAALIDDGSIDVAVLDVVLPGGDSAPVATKLVDIGVPFVVMSGYRRKRLPDAMRKAPFLTKPFTQLDLIRSLASAVRSRP